MAKLIFPHNFRIIPRIILVLLIVAGFGMSLASGEGSSTVKGAKESQNEVFNMEIEKTLKVIEMRPDYVGAWVRLSVLYEQVGESELSNKALETAKRLNPDL